MHALQLRKNCREVFLLCDIQRHSLAEAAQILGISRVAALRRPLGGEVASVCVSYFPVHFHVSCSSLPLVATSPPNMTTSWVTGS
jgi:Sigma-70, region 4